MNKYQRGKIYQIVSNVTNDVYYGSTCEPTLARRLSQHRSDYEQHKKGNKHYVTSFKILETGDYDILLVESFPCDSKDELTAREGYYIRNNVCVNKCIPNRTRKEYRNDNIDRIRKEMAIYRENNKDKIKQYSAIKREHNFLKRHASFFKINVPDIQTLRREREIGTMKKLVESQKKKVLSLNNEFNVLTKALEHHFKG